MSAMLVVGLVATTTYLVRASFLAVLPMRRIPDRIERRLKAIGPAAMAAVLASALFTDRAAVAVVSVPATAGCLAAFLAVRRSGDVKMAFVVGLPVMWLVAAAVG
jgi:branched-subunit amino acid transport protein